MRVYRRLALVALVATPFLAMAATDPAPVVTGTTAAADQTIETAAGVVEGAATKGTDAATAVTAETTEVVGDVKADATTAANQALATATGVVEATTKSIDDVIVPSKPAGVLEAIKDAAADAVDGAAGAVHDATTGAADGAATTVSATQDAIKKVGTFTVRLDKEGCYSVTGADGLDMKMCIDDALARKPLSVADLEKLTKDAAASATATVDEVAKPTYSWVKGTVTNMGVTPICDFSLSSATTDLTKTPLKIEPSNLPITAANVVPKELVDLAPKEELKFSLLLPFDVASNTPNFVGFADTVHVCNEVQKAFVAAVADAVDTAAGAPAAATTAAGTAADATTAVANAAADTTTAAATGAVDAADAAGTDAKAKIDKAVTETAKAVEEVTAQGDKGADVQTTSPAGKVALSSVLVLGAAAVASAVALLA